MFRSFVVCAFLRFLQQGTFAIQQGGMMAMRGQKTKMTPPATKSPEACSDTTVPPVAEYVVFDLSRSTVDATCSEGKFGDKLPDSCCTAPGGFNMLGKTFTEYYKSSGDDSCPLILDMPPKQLYGIMQCNADGTVTYGEQCPDDTCVGCKSIMTMSPGCYRANDMPGMNWFVMSKGCECKAKPSPAPSPSRPKPKPSPTPSKPGTTCADWCHTHTHPWSVKCGSGPNHKYWNQGKCADCKACRK